MGGDRPESLSPAQAESLMEAARQARSRAYAPYSGFGVGAALLDAEGRVHAGVNVENASYGLATCAEQAAVARAVAEGSRSFRAIAVAGGDDRLAAFPCGRCRQVLQEFSPGMSVVVAGPNDGVRVLTLSALLPEPFTAESLPPRDPLK